MDDAGKPGIRLLPLATETTTSTGAFELRSDIADLPGDYVADADEGVNIKLLLTDDSGSMIWNYTLFPSGVTEPGYRTAVDAQQRMSTSEETIAPAFQFDIGLGTASEVQNKPATWARANGKRLTISGIQRASRATLTRPATRLQDYADRYLGASGRDQRTLLSQSRTTTGARQELACGMTVWSSNWKKNVQEHHLNVNAMQNMPATVVQGTSSSTSHTLGVAFEKSGGELSRAGTTTKSYGNEVTQTNVVNSSISNRANYREQVTACQMGTEWKQYSMYDWFTDQTSIVHTVYRYCSHKDAGAKWSTTSAKNVTYASGVKFPGLSLSAQSGYGNSQNLTFTFKSEGRMCGNSSEGPLNSSQVDATY